jgi:hypothetical protein
VEYLTGFVAPSLQKVPVARMAVEKVMSFFSKLLGRSKQIEVVAELTSLRAVTCVTYCSVTHQSSDGFEHTFS